MKELTRTQTSTLTGGDRKARMAKQWYKCTVELSQRACNRWVRMNKR